MAVKASATITLTSYRDTQSVTRYYKLQPAGSSAPLKPETKPPSSDWTDSEPACDISKELYFCDLTIFSNGEGEYSKVSKSTSYEAAKKAYNRADNATKVATNFIEYNSTNGLIIGNKTSGSWSGYRSQILPDSFNILDESSNVLASYGDAKIELGKNAVSSIIEMCGGMARVSARYGGLTTIYSDNGGYQTTLDYDFNETIFKSRVGSNYGFYEFSYSGGVWECSYSGDNAGYVQVNLSDYGITLKTTSVNEHAGITIQYWNGSEATFINADTTKPSRKLILGLAESGTADNLNYANIEIERSKKGDVEHSKINLLTVHDGANVAGIYLNNGNIGLDVSGEVLINGIPLDYIVEQGTYIGWKYIKWNSGMAECFGYISLGSISVSAVGNVYRGTATVVLPGIFNDNPRNVHITNGNPLSSVISINGRATDADHVSVYVWKSTKGAVDGVYASFHVIGTWK